MLQCGRGAPLKFTRTPGDHAGLVQVCPVLHQPIKCGVDLGVVSDVVTKHGLLGMTMAAALEDETDSGLLRLPFGLGGDWVGDAFIKLTEILPRGNNRLAPS